MPVDKRPSEISASRRKFLGAGAALSLAALAGCTASGSSETPDCTTSVVEHGDGEILQQASVMSSDGSDILLVALTQAGDELPATRVLLRDLEGELFGEIPTTGAREYRYNIGSLPRHGRVKLVAENGQGNELDSLTIEYNCPST